MAMAEVRRRQRKSSTLRNLTITIEEDVYQRLDNLSVAQGISRAALISRFLRDALEGLDRAS